MAKKKNRLVKKSNALIRSHWVINSVWEARLVAAVAAKIHIDDEDFKEHSIPISELIEGSELRRSGQIYDLIEAAAKKLMSKVITINEPNGDTLLCCIFSMCRISPNRGVIEVRFDAALKNHYLELKEKFTQYALEEFMQLPSIYSQRLFEILMSWRNVPEGEITISIDELHEQLDTPPSQRKDFKQFRVYVLEKAQKDIMANPDSSLDYEWEALKEGKGRGTGRKVTSVRFIFDRRKVAAEREEKRKEEETKRMRRAADIVRSAARCHAERSVLSPDEQSRRDLHPEPEVCEYCKKSNLPIPNCQLYKRAEVVE